MGTLDLGDVADVTEVLGDSRSEPLAEVAAEPGRRSGRRLALIGGALVVLLGTTATILAAFVGRLGSHSGDSWTTYTASRGNLLISVTEEGSLESAENVDIKCQVAGGTSVVWVTPDGTEVNKGTEILRLDSSKLEVDVNQQKIAYEKARASEIQAAKDFATAEIAVLEYVEGTFKKDLREAESKVAVAQENLHSAENALQHGERMFRKGYISPLQLAAQKAAVERAKLDLGTAQIARDVLERFTKKKTTQDLESKRDAAQAKRDSEKASLALEEAKLKRLTTQLENCTIQAPQAGLVIYANDRARWDPDSEVKVGMKTWEGQTILRLPNLNAMRVKVIVHESKVDQLRKGMRARIRIQDRELYGVVSAIANRPEQDWYNATSKKYAVQVDVDGTAKDLRPGMTAEVEILVANPENVVSLPVAAVAEKRGQKYCCVKKGEALTRRNVVLGQGNDRFVEIKEGIDVGEIVVLNPRAALGEPDEAPEKRTETDVKKRFGTGTAKAEAKAKDAEKTASKEDGRAKSAAKPEANAKGAEKTDGKEAPKAKSEEKAKPDGK